MQNKGIIEVLSLGCVSVRVMVRVMIRVMNVTCVPMASILESGENRNTVTAVGSLAELIRELFALTIGSEWVFPRVTRVSVDRLGMFRSREHTRSRLPA